MLQNGFNRPYYFVIPSLIYLIFCVYVLSWKKNYTCTYNFLYFSLTLNGTLQTWLMTCLRITAPKLLQMCLTGYHWGLTQPVKTASGEAGLPHEREVLPVRLNFMPENMARLHAGEVCHIRGKPASWAWSQPTRLHFMPVSYATVEADLTHGREVQLMRLHFMPVQVHM